MSAVVVGVDPGQTTGIAVFLVAESRHPAVPAVIHPHAVQVVGSDLVKPFVETIFEWFCHDRPLLALEAFVVSTRAARSRKPIASILTRTLIATLQEFALDHRNGTAVEVAVRPAGLVKPWATDQRLDAAGLLEPTAGMRHARDAARHALFAAVHEGLIRDPLSKATG